MHSNAPTSTAAELDLAVNDLGPLAWVLDELRKSLDGAAKALKRFVRDAELARGSDLAALDANQLRIARQQLHQAVGALEMVGLPGPALVLRAMEAAVQKFIQRPELCSQDAANKIESASFALTEYLEGVLADRPVSAVSLFPQYRDIQKLVGADRVHPADLWIAEWRWIDAELALPATARAYDAAGRTILDQSVLQIMKGNPKPAADDLKELCLGLAAGQGERIPRAFWKIAAAYSEAVSHGLIGGDLYVKRAASRILLQFASLLKGDAGISDRLAQDLVFFCAQAIAPRASDAPVLSAVRAAYGLARFKPVDYEAVQFGRFDPALLAQARKRIVSAKETWSSLAAGDVNKFKLVADQFSLVTDSLVKLHPPSELLAQALTRVVDATVRSVQPPTLGVAMEVATSVLYLEAAFEDLDPNDPQLKTRTAHLAARLDGVHAGGEPQALEPWMEELYRRVSDRQTMGSVVGELRLSLSELEKSLDVFFRDPQNKAALTDVPGQLSQMRGVLSVLGLDQASQAVLRMRDRVEEMLVTEVDDQMARQAGTFDQLGNNLGALSFLIDMLSYQPALAKKLFVYDAEKGELRPLMGRTQSVADAAAAAFTVHEPSLSVDVASLVQNAEDGASSADLTVKLDALAVQAALAGQAELARTAQQAAVAVAADNAHATTVALNTLAASVAAPVPAAAAEPSDDFEEDDLRDIFLEEAREVVVTGQEALDALAANPADLSQLTTLRRAFHTLKGSSRMVGLNEFGEAAWSMEQVLNSWLAEQKPASDDLRTLASQTMAGFSRWVGDIAANTDGAWKASAFCASADLMRTEGRFMPLELPGSAPSNPAEPQPEQLSTSPDESVNAPALAELPPVDSGMEAFDFGAAPEAAAEMPQSAAVSAPAATATPAIEPMEAAFGTSFEIEGIDLDSLAAVSATPPDGAALPAAASTAAELAPFDFESPSTDVIIEMSTDDFDANFVVELSSPGPEPVAETADPALDLLFGFEPAPLQADAEPAAASPAAPELPVAEVMSVAETPFDFEAPVVAEATPSVAHDPLPAGAADPFADLSMDDIVFEAAPALPEAQAPTVAPMAPDLPPGFTSEPEVGSDQGNGDQGDSESDEQIKVIGALRIGIPLYNVFLNEADEWSRRLVTELTEWMLESDSAMPDAGVALAHSLAGSSATVGFQALSDIARALEDALQHAQAHPRRRTPEMGKLFVDAAEDIRRLLHQFAAGFLKEPNVAILEQLRQLDFTDSRGASEIGSLEDSSMGGSTAGSEAAFFAFEAPSGPAEPAEPAEPELVAPAPVVPAPAPDLTAVPPSVPNPFTAAPVSPAVVAAPTRVTSRTTLVDFDEDTDDEIDAVDAIDPDLFPIFEEEGAELMPQLGAALRQWSARPDNQNARMEVLRALHTLKGSARLAGALRLGEMAHRIESDIESIGSDGAAGQQFEPLLHRFDAMQANFENLRHADAAAAAAPLEPLEPEAAIVFVNEAAPADAVPPAASPTEVSAETGQDGASAGTLVEGAGRKIMIPAPQIMTVQTARKGAAGSIRVRAQLLDRMVNQAGEVMITRSRLEAELGQLRGSLNDMSGNLNRLRAQLRDIEVQAESQMQSRLAQAKEAQQGFDPLEFDRFTRVQELTRMMAESVNDVATVQRTLQRTVEATEDDLIAQARQTRELQRDLLRTRMVEFEGISDRLYRVVRLASKETGKQVRLDLTGGTIEMDRGTLDRMTPAFEHLLRNCVAHGIESPEVRTAANKDPVGLITVTLRQEGNDVSVEFSDDGAGLDLKRIAEKAVSLGLAHPGQELSDQDAANMIFMPGFSTASQVTELAGRGIGMDVVRSEVNALGGRIETTTVVGQGTKFKLVLPLTTAVTQVVMLRADKLSIGVPANVVENVRRATLKELQQAYNSGTLDVAGEAVPFFWAGALLQASHQSSEPQTKTLPVVIFRSAAQRIALHVDDVLGNQEVVVKNLGPQMSRLPGLAGMSVLASGAVVLIYNPVALAAVYGVQARAWSKDSAEPHVLEAAAGSASSGAATSRSLPMPVAPQIPLVLVVDDSITVRRVTQRLLQREGYRVSLAADGLQALERLQEELPSVVLSDIEMPRMDGFDLARNIRGDERLRKLPIIMITSRIAEKHREYAKELGVDHYLGKPYPEDELMSLVRHYCAVAVPA